MMINNLIDKQMFCTKIAGAYWIYYKVVAMKIGLVIKRNVDDTSYDGINHVSRWNT